jgi:predicted HAD superfamily hydrolase
MRVMDLKMFASNKIKLEDMEVVAFDVFDTIIYRNVSPFHVHRMWANSLIDRFMLTKSADQIVKMKFECGRLAKLQNLSRGMDKEYHYRQMTDLLKKRLNIAMDSLDFYSACLDIELRIEESVCYVPDEVKEFVTQVQMKKKIICISDFYLPGESLIKLLGSKGIHVDDLFVSSDYLLQKKTGRLYAAVVERLGVEADKIVMIGDDKTSDVDNAKEAGLGAIYLENKKQHVFYEQFENCIKKSRDDFNQLITSEKIKNRQIPFFNVTFLMYIFIDRLFKELKNDGCEHALFMSREGEFFKKLFDSYQELTIDENERIKTHYFYVSRRATIVPSIHNAEKNEFKEIYKNYSEMSVRDFLRNLGIDKNERVLNELSSIDVDRVIHDFPNSKEYQTILETREFKEICLRTAEEQRSLFLKYLDDMKINYRAHGLYLVDVGYSGTSQNNISKIFNDEIIIHGYYMISYAEKMDIPINNTKKGIVYDINSGEKKNAFTYNSAVIEMLSLASHCGVDSYMLNDGGVVPVFHENERELICYRQVIAHIQETIMEGFKKIALLVKCGYLDENFYKKNFLKQYKRFIYNPTIKEMEEYLTIPFVDNFAIYREYTVEENREQHRAISISGMRKIILSKGQCLKLQNTHWIAAALYKLDMRCLNPILYRLSGVTMKMFDVMAAAAKKNRGNDVKGRV